MIAFGSNHDRDLYEYAIYRAFSVLIGHAERFGRGWYFLADGKILVAAEVVL